MAASADVSKKKSPSVLKSIFEVIKNFLDEEFWYLIRPLFPKFLVTLLNPFLIGGLMVFTFFDQIYESIDDVIEAIRDPKAKQRLTRIGTDLLIAASSITGISLCISLIASGLGAVVAGVMLMPLLLPALMVGCYSIALARRVYSFIITKKKESDARAIYEKWRSAADQKIEQLSHRIAELKLVRRVIQQNDPCFEQKRSPETLSDEDEKKHTSNVLAEINLTKQIESIQTEIAEIKADIEIEFNKQQDLPCHKDRLDAEREVGFATAQLATSTLILASAIFGAGLLIGGSVLSFGTLPLGLLLAGVLAGAVVKGFQWIDEAKDHAPTKWIRGLFMRVRKPEMQPEKKPERQIEKQPEKQCESDPIILPKTTQPISIPESTPQMLRAMRSNPSEVLSPTAKVLSPTPEVFSFELSSSPAAEIPPKPEVLSPAPKVFAPATSINWRADNPDFSPVRDNRFAAANSMSVDEHPEQTMTNADHPESADPFPPRQRNCGGFG